MASSGDFKTYPNSSEPVSEPCTVVVTPRDRFSTIPKCLGWILEHTLGPVTLMAVIGGAPDAVRKNLEAKFGGRVKFVFESEFLNTAQLRNIALRQISTRLAAFVDSDVFVRPNWLGPMIECQKETGAKLVSPIILDRDNRIHTAGNNFYKFYKDGEPCVTMELRYANLPMSEKLCLQRQASDFGEVHCQLVDVKTAVDLGIYDERLREMHEMDAGLTLTKAGCLMMFEPKSSVYLYYPKIMDKAEDLGIFMWKWDMDAMRQSFAVFKAKWGLNVDFGEEFSGYLRSVNRRVGFFSRRFPSQPAVAVDLFLFGVKKMGLRLLGKP